MNITNAMTKCPEDKQIYISISTYLGASSFQADVCHAYQILHKHGIPDENIVVMMYDDIAYNKEWVLYPYGNEKMQIWSNQQSD